MNCWVCKREINKATIVHYTDGIKDKARDVCEKCYTGLKFNACHFVEVKRIQSN